MLIEPNTYVLCESFKQIKHEDMKKNNNIVHNEIVLMNRKITQTESENKKNPKKFSRWVPVGLVVVSG